MVETFSSDGPRRIFYSADGTPFTPGNVSATGGQVLQKPDLTAADGVSVTGVGGFGSPFFGTSAAAPHAGAIAALVKSANPALTPAQIRSILTSTAIDIQAPGVDRDSGAGIVMARAAVGATGAIGTAFLVLDSVQATDNPGNGNGAPEAGEGAKLTVTLKNYGVVDATGISATLTSPTAGISITQPNATAFPNLAPIASAANTSPLLFTTASDFPCPTAGAFRLNVSYAGGLTPSTLLDFKIAIGPPSFSIVRNLDGSTPGASPGVATAAGVQVGRLFRDGAVAACGTQKVINSATPVVDSTLRAFESYQFSTCANSVPSCATVTLSGTNAANLFSAAYAPSFNPGSILQNYKADPGSSAALRTYSFDLPSGSSAFAIDVHDVPVTTPAGTPSGNRYTLTVTGACLGRCDPPNHVPIAKAKNVTVPADAACTANASIDDGSSDADGDSLTIVQSPAAPYPLGTTTVLMTVSDPKGATSQATGTVTVVDATPPVVSGFLVSPSAQLWPPDHRMVDVLVDYGAADNCSAASCVLGVSSNEPVDGLGDGDTAPDWTIVDAHHLQLRAERSGKGSGRTYTITLTCADAAGNVTVKTGTVLVPHDQR